MDEVEKAGLKMGGSVAVGTYLISVGTQLIQGGDVLIGACIVLAGAVIIIYDIMTGTVKVYRAMIKKLGLEKGKE